MKVVSICEQLSKLRLNLVLQRCELVFAFCPLLSGCCTVFLMWCSPSEDVNLLLGKAFRVLRRPNRSDAKEGL